MKTYYFNSLRVLFPVLFILLFGSKVTQAQTEIANYDFDTNLDGWTDGGVYADRTTGVYNCNNAGAIFIQYDIDIDNSAVFTSPSINLSSYSELTLSACLMTLNLENGDGFDLQFFDGTNWNTIRQFIKGVDFFGNGEGDKTNISATIDDATYNFAANSSFRFIGQMSANNEYAVFDDVVIATGGCATTINSFPYNEGFETGLGGWTQDDADDRDWIRNTGGTPSANTGPNSAQEGSWYMFTEGSNPNFNTEHNLASPCIDLTGETNAEFSFYYHMYGTNMGRLDVEVSTDGGSTYSPPIWSQIGENQSNQTDAWELVNIDISSYVGQTIKIRFSGFTGSDFTSDMSIDDISVTTTSSPPGQDITVYYNTFDTSNEGWTNVTSTNDSWVRTNNFTTTDELGEGSFFRNTNYNSYNNNTDIIIESPVYDFSNLENLKLSLDIKFNTENSFDGMRMLYSVNGGTYSVLGASGDGTNWYGGNVNALGSDGWSDDGHTADPAFSPHSQFGNSMIDLSNAIFANQSNVRFRIQFASNGSNVAEGVAFDNFKIEGNATTVISPSTTGPANLTSELRLWLKANSGIANTDNTPLTLWEDQAFGSPTIDQENAFSAAATAPTYRDSGSRNINYNPVADFDNTTTNYMNGKGGLYSQDLFVVFRSDDTIENQTGAFSPGRQFAIGARFADISYHEDATGIAAGSSTGRYDNEVIAYNISSYPLSGPPNDTSYGRAYTSTTDTFSNHPVIVNVKTNASGTASEIYKNGKRVDNTTGIAGDGTNLNFNELNNSAFLLGTGRSGIAGRTTSQMNGMIAEVISYSSPNSAINQQKIESYLALKYGVTLQDNASTLLDHRLNDTNYIDSAGTILWNTSDTDGSGNSYNYDVAGIGRDDASLLDQRQSRSQNDEADGVGPTSGFVTMGLTDIYDTNNQNISSTSPLTDRNFIMWGNNNASLDATPSTIAVDMSANIAGINTNVSFIGMQRVWRVKEIGDVSRVKVSIPESVVRNITPPGNYLMFISETGVFTPTAQYRVMSTDGSGNLSAEYDFPANEVRYITFGYAPEIIVERSVNFEPVSQNYIDVEDNLDLNSAFTLSTWIKRESGSRNKSIIAKRDVGYTEGYDLKILNDRRVEMSWRNGGTRRIRSSVEIPENVWHHIAITHDGTTARLYIDGVLDTTETLPLPLNTSRSFLIGAAGRDGSATAYFDGNIDEVRVWNTALNASQLRYLMNQELEDNPSTIGKYFSSNSILPTKNDVSGLDFTNLRGYFPMSRYTYTNTNDDSGNDLIGYLRQLRTVDFQTAPLPYISTQNGNWEDNSTWTNGNLQTIPGDRSLVDEDIYVNWNIVETNHDLIMDNDSLEDIEMLLGIPLSDGNDNEGNRTVLAHILNSGTVTVDGDNTAKTGFGYTVTHYLEISGKIDLEGESQLIQTTDSDLLLGPNGELEKDQQGTTNTYHYNYWSSPVGETSIAPSSLNPNRHSYSVRDIMYDGSNAVNFSGSGYDGSDTTPITIADYWIWKFANNPDGDYSAWEHVRRTGNIEPGEGFTMKGPGSTGAEQNYTFLGKPNNSDISLTISANNDYLVGNPYASAIDARQFIIDNGPTLYYEDAITPEADAITSGTLYFWEHWGGGDHILANYQGGYATYNLSGSLAAPFSMTGGSDPDVSQTGSGTKAPGRYIPVGQGFFVVAANGGTINFNNGQRIFKKESNDNGEFFRTTESTENTVNETTDELDTRHKLKLGFDSVGGQHRQLLLTIDENTTTGIDWGYDGTTYEYKNDDMFWGIENNFYVIQGANEMDANASYPLIVYTSEDGINTFQIDELINFGLDENVFLHDMDLDYYHNLKDGDYEIFLNAGYYDSRFRIVFEDQNESLSTDNTILNEDQLDVRYANNIDKVVLINPHGLEVKTIQVFNIIGQEIISIDKIENRNYTEYNVGTLSSGPYIIKLNTVSGSVSKKVLVD